MGVADIASQDARLKDPQYRKKMYESAYRFDLEKYGKELSLTETNSILAEKKRLITAFLNPDIQNKTVDGLRGSDIILVLGSHKTEKSADFESTMVPRNAFLDSPINNARELGESAQYLYQELLPSLRFWVHWDQYIIGGAPDGVGDNYVYEFKTTTQSTIDRQKDVAQRQAQLYAYMFKRPKIRVQIAQFHLSGQVFPLEIRDLSRPEITTINLAASNRKAQVILTEFDRAFHENHNS